MAVFHEKVEYKMIRKMALQHIFLVEFPLFTGPSSFETFEEEIIEYIWSCMWFVSIFPIEETSFAKSKDSLDTMRYDIREAESLLGSRLSDLAGQFHNLASTLQKRQESRAKQQMVYSYCRKGYHYSIRCLRNPENNIWRDGCKRLGHTGSCTFTIKWPSIGT